MKPLGVIVPPPPPPTQQRPRQKRADSSLGACGREGVGVPPRGEGDVFSAKFLQGEENEGKSETGRKE